MLSRYVVSQVKHNSYFLIGLGIGLWLALATIPLDEEVVTCETVTTAANDDYEPQREERPLGSRGQAGRSVQRPRYYSTELGMRSGLLTGVLTSEEVLETRAAALNRTAARLQPALRFFITASTLQDAPGRANVVGFTDTREMLKPFHALKYLADNYLEEYDFFFLVSDVSFVNSRRLTELVSKISVSQDIYMGTVADDDTHYCTLDGGILLSNSVLRSVHSELDWCVRNSYSPHHHENLGRCVLHAAHLSCISQVQGESYASVRVDTAGAGIGGVLTPALADAVVVQPAVEPSHFHQLLAYVSRVYLERAQASIALERGQAALSARRHPRGYHNSSWPVALRDDAGLAPPRPPSRFDHLRWTRFNASHAFMPDDHLVVAPLAGAYKEAVHLILDEVRAWAANKWSAVADADESGSVTKISPKDISLEEGAWCWDPPVALRYRLLLRLPTRQADGSTGGRGALVQVEAARALGAARLAPARYVTESARVSLVLPLPVEHAAGAAEFLHRYNTVCLQRDTNTALVIVIIPRIELPPKANNSTLQTMRKNDNSTLKVMRDTVRNLTDKYRNTQIDIIEAPEVPVPWGEGRVWSEVEIQKRSQRIALTTALPKLGRNALCLLALPYMEFTEDFLNRVRMNTIGGEQWFLPLPFTRYAQFANPLFVDAAGVKPTQNTGRFPTKSAPLIISFYKQDYVTGYDNWRKYGGGKDVDPADVLAASPLRCIRSPEPALLLPPRPTPCTPCNPLPVQNTTNTTTDPNSEGHFRCLLRERDRAFNNIHLGARHALAKLLLQTQAELDSN